MQIQSSKSVITFLSVLNAIHSILLLVCLVAATATTSAQTNVVSSSPGIDESNPTEQQQPQQQVNSIDDDNSISSTTGDHKHVACGTIASNLTHILVKNPHHPEPTYVKTICETVVERSDQSIRRLNIRFKQFDLYRPTYDGTCLHDRFGVYNDLNVAVTPILCGSQTGNNLSIPFIPPQTSLIVSIATSDLDHDRFWLLEIEQEK